MMKIWNVTLIILTFFLTIFGTFMTRSGIVQSVHAFGQDTKLAWIFTIFMAITLIVSFGFVIKRLPELRSRATLRLVAVARGGVHRQQLDPAVRGVLHPVRHDVPDDLGGGRARAHHRRAALLQQVDGADRAGPAVPDRRRAADRLAQGDGLAPALPVLVAERWRRP